MANYQSLQTVSQIVIAAGIILTALGGYGAYHFGQKVDEEKESVSRPFVDICHRGIEVKIFDQKAYFDIPYCSGKNANAFNVKLEIAVVLQDNQDFRIISEFSHKFPDGITLSYETGKSINFSLQPFPFALENIYICVKGTYTNEKGNLSIPLFHVFKYNIHTRNWQMAISDEYDKVYGFLN